MGQKFHKIEAVRLEGGDPPQAVRIFSYAICSGVCTADSVSEASKLVLLSMSNLDE